jgi:hypothetical protein
MFGYSAPSSERACSIADATSVENPELDRVRQTSMQTQSESPSPKSQKSLVSNGKSNNTNESSPSSSPESSNESDRSSEPCPSFEQGEEEETDFESKNCESKSCRVFPFSRAPHILDDYILFGEIPQPPKTKSNL